MSSVNLSYVKAITGEISTLTVNNLVITGMMQSSPYTISDQNMEGRKIKNLGTPTEPGDAVNKHYADTLSSVGYPVTGGPIYGSINMQNMYTVTNIIPPFYGTDAATKTYADTVAAGKLSTTGGTMSGSINMGSNYIQSLASPATGTDAANKNYVDSQTALKLSLSGGAVTGAVTFDTALPTSTLSATSANQFMTRTATDARYLRFDTNQGYTTAPNIYRWFRFGGGNAYGFVGGNFTALGDGMYLGYNWFVDDTNTINRYTNFWGSRIKLGYSSITFGLTQTSSTSVIDEFFAITQSTGRMEIYKTLSCNATINMQNTAIVNMLNPVSAQDAATKNYVDTQVALKLSLSGGTMSGAIAMSTNKITGLGDPTLAQDGATKNYVDTQVALRLALTGGTMSGAIAMGTNKITGLGDPTTAQDGATKNYVDTQVVSNNSTLTTYINNQDALRLALTGGTMTGSIAMSTNKITGMGDPTAAQDAATKNYVDNQGALKLSLSGGTMTGAIAMGTFKITGMGDPTLAQDAATKNYVDTQTALRLALTGGTLTGAVNAVKIKFNNTGLSSRVSDETRAPLTVEPTSLSAPTSGYSAVVIHARPSDALYFNPGLVFNTLTTDAVTNHQWSISPGYPGSTNGWNGLAFTFSVNGTNTHTNTKVAAFRENLTFELYGDISMLGTNKRIQGLSDPILFSDAATKNYTDNALAAKLSLSGGTMTGSIAMSTNKITGLGDPTAAQDAATKNYVDTQTALKLSLSGGTMTGAIAMGTFKITGMGDPTAAQDAATKNYVDTTKLALSGGTMTGAIAMGTFKITGLGDPTTAQDAATKNYVDTQDALKLSLSGGTVTGLVTFNTALPTSTLAATTANEFMTQSASDTRYLIKNTTQTFSTNYRSVGFSGGNSYAYLGGNYLFETADMFYIGYNWYVDDTTNLAVKQSPSARSARIKLGFDKISLGISPSAISNLITDYITISGLDSTITLSQQTNAKKITMNSTSLVSGVFDETRATLVIEPTSYGGTAAGYSSIVLHSRPTDNDYFNYGLVFNMKDNVTTNYKQWTVSPSNYNNTTRTGLLITYGGTNTTNSHNGNIVIAMFNESGTFEPLDNVVLKSGKTVKNVTDPTLSTDAANKNYVDTQDALKLSLSGGAVTGVVTYNTSLPTSTLTASTSTQFTTLGTNDARYLRIDTSQGYTSLPNIYRSLRFGGGNSYGYIGGNFPLLFDGMYLGYNWFVDDSNTAIVFNLSATSSRIRMTYTGIAFGFSQTAGSTTIDEFVVMSKTNNRIDFNRSIRATTGIDMASTAITNLLDPTSAQDAATKNYVDTQDALKLSLTGGTITGNVTMTNAILDITPPASSASNYTRIADGNLFLDVSTTGSTVTRGIYFARPWVSYGYGGTTPQYLSITAEDVAASGTNNGLAINAHNGVKITTNSGTTRMTIANSGAVSIPGSVLMGITTNTWANRPTVAYQGSMFRATNFNNAMFIYNGTRWVCFNQIVAYANTYVNVTSTAAATAFLLRSVQLPGGMIQSGDVIRINSVVNASGGTGALCAVTCVVYPNTLGGAAPAIGTANVAAYIRSTVSGTSTAGGINITSASETIMTGTNPTTVLTAMGELDTINSTIYTTNNDLYIASYVTTSGTAGRAVQARRWYVELTSTQF